MKASRLKTIVIVILLLASVLKSCMKYAGVQAFLSGVRPCVAAMILATAAGMELTSLAGFVPGQAALSPDGRAADVLALLTAVHLVVKKVTGHAPPPIGMIVLSAVLGLVFWPG